MWLILEFIPELLVVIKDLKKDKEYILIFFVLGFILSLILLSYYFWFGLCLLFGCLFGLLMMLLIKKMNDLYK